MNASILLNVGRVCKGQPITKHIIITSFITKYFRCDLYIYLFMCVCTAIWCAFFLWQCIN